MAYAHGPKNAADFKLITDLTSYKDKAGHLHVNKLASGFALGTEKFFEDIEKDSQKAKLVNERAKDFFTFTNF